MATATYDSGTSEFSGGSSGDRLNLTTCAAATTELTLVYDNVAYQTTAEARSFNFDDGSFSDFTGALLMMRNDSNNEAITFRLGGDVIIGRADDLEDRGFELVIGNRDLFNTHLNEIDLCDQDAQIVCRNEQTRLIVRHVLDIDNSSLTGEPGARNGIQLQNNNADSQLRLTLLGGRAALDSDYPGVGTGGGQYGANKPAGTEIFKYDVSDAVTVRDIEWYSGYLDWRPDGDWAPPTRAVFVSESGIKFLVNSDAGRPDSTLDDPLIFGEAGSSFVLTLGNVANSWWLEGLSSTENDFRTIYLNMDGPNWATQAALFDQGRAKVLENHLVVDYTIIDALANPIDGALVRLHSRDPQISAPAASGTPSITFPEANARVNTSTSDAEGNGSLGGVTGAYNQAVVVEAFGKRITGGAGGQGTVDGAYTSAAHAKAVYASHNALTYDVFSFGRQIVTGVAWTAALSGQDGAGKQTLGVIQLNDEVNLTSADAANVPTTATTFDDIFDMLYGWAITNRAALPFTVNAGDIDFGSLTVGFSTTGVLTVDLANDLILIPSDATLAPGNIITSLTTTGTFSATGVTITGQITDVNGTPSTVTIIADDGDTVAYYLADGTEISRSTLNGTDRVTFGLTPAQSAVGQRISVAKSGFESRIRTISTAGGGAFTTDMASLIEKRGPDGIAQFNSSVVDSRVSITLNVIDTTNVTARINIGNAQVRAAHAFNAFEIAKLTADGMKYIAFGGEEPGILQDPVNGDALYLPMPVRLRRAAASDSNATVLATVYHVDGTPIDDSNGGVAVVGGRILDDFAQTILVDTDLDLTRAGVQSLAGLMVNVRKELVTHGVGAELTVIVINPRDTSQGNDLLQFRSGDDIVVDGTDTQVFSQIVDDDGIHSLYLIGQNLPFSAPITISKGIFATTLTSADMQTSEADISSDGHWAIRETTVLEVLFALRDSVDANQALIRALPSAADNVSAIQVADFESGTGTNTLEQMLGLIRSDIASIPSSGSGTGTGSGGSGAATADVLNALGYLTYGDTYRSTWIAGTFTTDDYVLHDGIFYKCVVARDSTHTDDPSVDTASWEIIGFKTAITELLEDSTYGLDALRMLIAMIPTNTVSNAPTVAQIVAGIQTADFEEGTGTKTLAQLLDDIIEGENTIVALEEDILGIEQNILDALNTRRVVSQAYTLDAPLAATSNSILWFNTSIPDEEFMEAFNERPEDTRFPTGFTLDNRDLSDPTNSAIAGNIVLGVGESATDFTSTTSRLSDRFERTWEILIEYDDDSWRFTHDEFDLDQTVPYQWTAASADIRTRIGEAIAAISNNSGAVVTFFTDNISLRSIEQEILQVAADTEDHILTHIGAAHFGTHFRGTWEIGNYANEDVVWFNNQFYEAQGSRTVSNTDDPATDSIWVNAHTPSAAEILSGIQNASFSDGGGDATLSVILGRITNRLDHNDYGLQALEGLIRSGITSTLNSLGYMIFGTNYLGSWETSTYNVGAYVVHLNVYYRCMVARDTTHTDNPSVDTTGWEIAEIYSTISPLLDSTHGLAALETLIDDIPTDNSLSQTDFNTLMNNVTGSIKDTYKANVASIPTDNSLSQTDFNTLMNGVSASIKNSYKADVSSIPTTAAPTVSQIVSGIQSADFEEGTGADTLAQVLSSIKSDIGDISTINTANALGGILFGASYQGTWEAGSYSIGQYVLHNERYYHCIVARTVANTDNPATDVTGWEVVDIYTAIAATENTTYGLSALKDLIDDVPTDNTLSQSDFNTLMDNVTDSIKDDYKADVSSIPTDNSISQPTFDALMSGVEDPIKNTYKADVSAIPTTTAPTTNDIVDAIRRASFENSLEVRQEYTLGGALRVSSMIYQWHPNDFVDTQFVDTFKANPSDTRYPTGLSLDSRPSTAQSFSENIRLSVGNVPTSGNNIGDTLSDDFADTWEIILSYGGNSWTFTHEEFNRHAGNPYRWIATSDETRTRIQNAISTIGTNSGATITFVVQDISTRNLENILNTIQETLDGMTGLSASEIVTAIQNADFEDGAGTMTLAQVLASIKSVTDDNNDHLENSTYGLSALKSLIDTVDTVLDTNKATLENATYGLSALQSLLDNIPTSNPSVSDIVTGIQGADFDEGAGTNTLAQMLAAIKNVIDDNNTHLEDTTYGLNALQTLLDNIPTSNPSASDIATAIITADFGTESGTQTLENLLDTIKTVVDANKASLEHSSTGLSALKTLIDNIPTDNDIASSVLDSTVLTGIDMTKALQIVLAVAIGQVSSQGSNLDLYTPVDGDRIVTVPKFVDDNRPSGAAIR